MSRHIAPLATLIFTVLIIGYGHAFVPTLEGEGEAGWSSPERSRECNPLVSFSGDLTAGRTVRERFATPPVWVMAYDFNSDASCEAGVLFADGTLRILSFSQGRLKTLSSARKLAPESPPVVLEGFAGESTGGLVGIDDRGDLVSIDSQSGRTRRVASGFSTLSYPVAADLDGDGDVEIAAVSDEGYMTVVKGKTRTRSDSSVSLLPDTRIIVADLDLDGQPEIAALSNPMEAFSPGRLGDDLEAGGLAVFRWDGRTLRLEHDLKLSDGEIFQTLSPLVVREEGGEPLLMLAVTEKNTDRTQIRSFSYNKGRLRERRKGPVTDPGEWIHVLGSATIGDSQRVSLVTAVLPVEGDGDLELNRLDLVQTRITLTSSVNTHAAGSRLLETALFGDFDRDGLVEILVPGEHRSALVLVSLDKNRLKDREIYRGSGKISTNLCPGDFNGDGNGDVAFGLDDGTLVILLGE